jgi:hypothetical protein
VVRRENLVVVFFFAAGQAKTALQGLAEISF